ncbi:MULTISPECIES: Asp-tRNA(Asn)/Glu-tRNA(Gln) amidotransferase subunit GatA [unclassified Pseudodesulfovibrio]|uniref:Asp-tRNA(Asn)/Glu-tRNA(Gln) amidotransferase subunit GatA n=1 Tax=unclassified Pseudodesulfovibrio TaxID=2661612 RepID=UPI000FEBFEEA|nr:MULTISPECIES: Asp-tRNA(Asn)/Glu-tRNA(Gln) amidotransferase subunit GatA [unclassified Pseudodesulfovibrio]MCJ2162982.1 Asp-tRNA(Asn)/Glu-tRNA(Gln) amidotransferase subunit GatA [Pseudodesulfovibrio sp. S3-i]RWU06980.1 Asp-tRNA(Asn)/Glu-tRNA(Gln) amidotransferase subunit GatA [Pseudodesulfovibrio sp. S3]
MSELYTKTLTEIAALLRSGEVTAVQAVKSCLDRIDATEPRVRALITVMTEEAMKEAEAMDDAGPDASKPLWGVPIVLKDLLTTKGTRTTCGSKILDDFVPFYDATAVTKLKEAGAVIVGKANMDEFAMGSSTENSAFFMTANPWDLERVPGGSSGGSGATVAAGQCYAALGTDTGGSIRTPASFCGIVGLKPTYGRISRFGLIAYGSSLDQIGPMTRSVEDAARLLQVMAGHDPKDSTSVDVAVPDYLAGLGRENLNGVTIGLPEEYWGEGLDAEVEEACKSAVARMEALGAKTVPLSLKLTEYAIATYYIIAMAEASSNLSRFDGVRFGHRNRKADELIDMYTSSRTEGFGDEVQRRIIMGTYVLSSGYYDAYYNKAAKVRRLLREDFDKAFEQCDLIAGPVLPTTAFKKGAKVDPLQMYLIDIFTISCNLAGLPGMSLPVGLGRDSGMPVGLQLMGPAFCEADMLSVAECLERNLDPMPMPEL